MERQVTRVEHLERLFKKYPDVPKEVVVKEDVIREGFQIPKKVADFDPRHRTYQLFTWDPAKTSEMEDKYTAVKLPDTIELQGGPYKLRTTVVRPRTTMNSPYAIDVTEGGLKVLDLSTRDVIADIAPFPPDPEWHSKSFEDGTLYREVCDTHVIVLRQCQLWGKKAACKYCDIDENAKAKKELGQVKSIAPKDPDRVATVIEEIFRCETRYKTEPTPPYDGARRNIRSTSIVHLNGGAIISKVQGLNEYEFYMRYVDKIRERIGNRWKITLQTAPWPIELEKEAYQRGVNRRSSNYEVWDPRLFAIICPGKDEYYGRDKWIRGILNQVDIFGEGNVTPGFVAGVEMAQPWGFKTVEEAVKSTTEGMDFFMSRGVTVRPVGWCVEALSQLAGQTPPPVDYFIQIDRNWFEIWTKYRLPVHAGTAMGTGLNTYPNSAAFDMGYESPGKTG